MLKQRVITATILIIVVVGVLVVMPFWVFPLASAAVVLIASWEWSFLMGVRSLPAKIAYTSLITILIVVALVKLLPKPLFYVSDGTPILYGLHEASCLQLIAGVAGILTTAIILWLPTLRNKLERVICTGVVWGLIVQLLYGSLLLTAMMFWCLMTVLIIIYPRGKFWQQSNLWQACIGLGILIPSFVCINFIFMYGHSLAVILLLAQIWIADIAAYFIGRKWGKKPLLPAVSPGKTRAGLYGAIITSVVLNLCFSVGVVMLMDSTLLTTLRAWLVISCLILVGLIIVLFSVVGDLTESMIKRNIKVKDSGRILPGHGGVLDRIDSLTAAAPVAVFAFQFWSGLLSVTPDTVVYNFMTLFKALLII